MKKPCATCGGTGQIGSFLGVSRFLLTWEECPGCCGTGVVETAADESARKKSRGRGSGKRSGRKKQGR